MASGGHLWGFSYGNALSGTANVLGDIIQIGILESWNLVIIDVQSYVPIYLADNLNRQSCIILSQVTRGAR